MTKDNTYRDIPVFGGDGKNLYVIGGSNGAGKTTFAKEFLPKYVNCLRFVNPDLIADSVHFFDNTGDKPELVFRDQGETTEIFDRFLFEQLTKQWGTK